MSTCTSEKRRLGGDSDSDSGSSGCGSRDEEKKKHRKSTSVSSSISASASSLSSAASDSMLADRFSCVTNSDESHRVRTLKKDIFAEFIYEDTKTLLPFLITPLLTCCLS